MLIADLVTVLERFAPPGLAEEWDNVGLLVGSSDDSLDGPVLLTIDLTEPVLEEALQQKARAIIAYHPPIFRPIKRIIGGSSSQAGERVIYRAARAGVAVYSPHTALDACTGGITDWLADGLMGPASSGGGGGDKRALRPAMRREFTQELKIVTFVPHEHVDTIRGALASGGAGIIGEYEICSFSQHGIGTFRGKAGTHPTIGRAEAFEQVTEHRLEMVCSRRALPIAIQTLRQFHPYEEPAIDIYPLEPRPERGIGAGRRITLDHPASLADLGERLKKHLGTRAVQIAAVGGDLQARVERIGVVPGAGGSLAAAAATDGCQLFVTGEMKHHEVNAALAQGLSVILGGHTATERGYLPRLAAALGESLPEVRLIVSTADRDPLEWC